MTDDHDELTLEMSLAPTAPKIKLSFKAKLLRTLAPKRYAEGIEQQSVAETRAAIRSTEATIYIRRLQADALEECAARVDPDKLVEPPQNLALPLLQAIPAAEHEPDLTALYKALLQKSMDSEAQPSVHPAYCYIVKELSPDEACLLQGFLHKGKPVARALLRARLMDKMRIDAALEITILNWHREVRNHGSIGLYYANLQRLGLIACVYDMHLHDEANYKELKGCPILEKWDGHNRKPSHRLELCKGYFNPTDFGRGFMRSVASAFTEEGDETRIVAIGGSDTDDNDRP